MANKISWNEVDAQQRYEFFHQMLPAFFHHEPQSAIRKIEAEGLEEVIAFCWRFIGNQMETPGQFEALPISVVQGPDSHPVGPWMVTFPASRNFPDLLAAMIIPEQENRYITLEPFDKSSPGRGLVCEWRNGERLNYGPEGGLDNEEFCRLLQPDALRELQIHTPVETESEEPAEDEVVTATLDESYGIGALIGGRYEITEKFGEFGMATIWKANDSETGQDVALKVPYDQSGLIQKFAAEVEIWNAVSPTNSCVPAITDVGAYDGLPWFATSWIDGGTLLDWKADDSSCTDPITAFNWLREIAKSLDQIHAAGFSHRDVKPDNILFDQRGNVSLIDFGISVRQDQVAPVVNDGTDEYHGTVEGTLSYMAPELLEGDECRTGRADQYALAVTLYEWLSGRKPYQGDSLLDLFKEIQKGAAPSLCDLIPDFSPSASDVVDKALSQNPENRFESCSGFAEVFLSFLGDGIGSGKVRHQDSPDRGQWKHVMLYERPEDWFCIFCGFDMCGKGCDYYCYSCDDSRRFAGGSQTMRKCLECDQMNIAYATYCEWCGGRFGRK